MQLLMDPHFIFTGNCAEISRLVKQRLCGVDDDEGGGPGSVTGLCVAADRGHCGAVELLTSLGVFPPPPLPPHLLPPQFLHNSGNKPPLVSRALNL